jgi:hypothetical protein
VDHELEVDENGEEGTEIVSEATEEYSVYFVDQS